jgi:predicted CoA-binding protein
MKKTLVLGASSNPERYSYKAIEMLLNHHHPVIAVGTKKDIVLGIEIEQELPWEKVDTVTLYLGPKNQNNWIEPIIALQPNRVIFNPGTENPEFQEKLNNARIAWEEACTLVLLSTNQY